MDINRTEVINKTEKANSFSFRYGGTGTDVKLYWDNVEDLKKGIDAVLEAKIYLSERLVEEIK